jgi:hypothetical protein
MTKYVNPDYLDYSDIAKIIAESIAKVGKPLSDDQYMVMAGAVAVWLEYKYNEGYQDGTSAAY